MRWASVNGRTTDSSELPPIEVPRLSSTPTMRNARPSMCSVLPTTLVVP